MHLRHSLREVRQKPKRRAFYGNFIAPGDLVFDIGANVGNRTEAFLALGANVVAVEPQPECANRLHKKFDQTSRLRIIQKALGSCEGTGRLRLCDSNTIASMSGDWIDSVRASGRFDEHMWDRELDVNVTTLDDLISEFGAPDFCKVDVEGFESEVLQGLSREIRALSFEFTPEFGSNARSCIARLNALADYKYNWSLGESMVLELTEWVEGGEMLELLDNVDRTSFGDVYARLS